MGDVEKKGIGFFEATAIGVGGMVGGGIFAVLGLAVKLSRGGAPAAFALAGVVALATAYSYTRLSVTYRSQGGTVTYLNRAFGAGLFTGGLNILLWISYIVMLSVYSYAFGSYGTALFGSSAPLVWKHALISGSIVVITGLNLLSARFIGDAEDLVVFLKLAILLVFIAFGLKGIEAQRLTLSSWSSPVSVAAGGMIIFLAYEGFELIANTAADVRTPQKTLPRAFFTAVGFVMALYILIAAVTVGNLPVERIVGAEDYALAEAARPFLGQTGYVLIGVAALLSTASAINATLYGSARLSYIIARDGELPEWLEHKVWNRPMEGLLITSAVTLVVANLFDLTSMSTMGSAGFLLIFTAVNLANAVLAEKTGSRRWLSLCGAGLCVAALGSLVWETARHDPGRLLILAAMAGLAFAVEGGFRWFRKREIRL